jgi:predicted transcriptional regulator
LSQAKLSKSAIILIALAKNASLPITVMMDEVGEANRSRFRNNILNQLIEAQLVEPTQKDSPQSPKQEYALTDKGKELMK